MALRVVKTPRGASYLERRAGWDDGNGEEFEKTV
jgi:hypothetical protein